MSKNRCYESCKGTRHQWKWRIIAFVLSVSVNVFLSLRSTQILATNGLRDGWSPIVTSAGGNTTLAEPTSYPKILIYITTHLSESHLRYFHCCWPILIRNSPLVQRAHILIASTATKPETELQTELTFLESLFSRNPSYTYWTPENFAHLQFCDAYKNVTRNRGNTNKPPVSYKQCLANYGVAEGLYLMKGYDWVVRLNPDVLIRQPTLFLDAMSLNSTLDAILIHCGIGTRQIHTDFWAIRPEILSNTSFQRMAKVGSHLNHERTAFREFRPTIALNRHAWVPNVEPSRGVCRVRGPKAPVYHAHDSCTSEEDMTCHALQGWNMAM